MHRAELHSYLLTRRCTLVHPPSTGPSSPIFSVRPSFDQFSSFPPLSLPPFPSVLSYPRAGDEIVSRGNTRRTGRLDASL